MYKALYSFAGQPGETSLVKGELVEVKEKDDNGGFFITSSPRVQAHDPLRPN